MSFRQVAGASSPEAKALVDILFTLNEQVLQMKELENELAAAGLDTLRKRLKRTRLVVKKMARLAGRNIR